MVRRGTCWAPYRATSQGCTARKPAPSIRERACGSAVELFVRPLSGHADPSSAAIHNTAPAVEWQWKVRNDKFEEPTYRDQGPVLGHPQRPTRSSPLCSATFSGRKVFCRLPGSPQGGKAGCARSAPLRRVYRAPEHIRSCPPGDARRPSVVSRPAGTARSDGLSASRACFPAPQQAQSPSAATGCWSSTRSATSRSSPKPPTCSSSS